MTDKKKIETGFYGDNLDKISEELQNALISIICDEIKKMSAEEQKQTMIQLLEKPGKGLSILNREALSLNATHDWMRHLCKVFRTNEAFLPKALLDADNSVIPDLYLSLVQNLSLDELTKFNCERIEGLFDLAAAIKTIQYAPKSLEKRIYRKYNIDISSRTLRDVFTQCLNIRNKYIGHNNKINRESLTKDIFTEALNTYKVLLDYFKGKTKNRIIKRA